MTIYNAQMNGPGSTWGACGGFPTHTPAHGVQALTDSEPFGLAQLKTFLPCQLGRVSGLGHFSKFSLLGGYLTALSEGAFGYQPSPDPSRARHPIRSVYLRWPGRGAFIRCLASRLNYVGDQHLANRLNALAAEIAAKKKRVK
jgi:hypothetical protein